MELRKAEAEVGKLRLDYENLRLATVTDAPPDLCLSSVLPPLAQVQQDRPVPSAPDPEATAESAPAASDGTSGGNTADGPLPPSAVPRTVSSEEALEALEQTKSRLDVLEGKCAKFRKRLSETDPVTNAPRYGSKTAARALALLDAYDALTMAVSAGFDSGIADTLRQTVKQGEDRRKQAQLDAHDAVMKEAADAKAAAQRLKEEERLKAMEADRERVRREAELHQQAIEARQRREEEEARARAAEREADRAYQDSIPKGADGVRAQLTALREGCSNEAGAFDVAIGALHTLFSQITARPEEIKFRRIRRDHPKFLQDIGRHPGGKEVFIAAGFKLETLDGVKSFFSKEPDLESDMDGWSDWFDGLKTTLQIIEEEMIK